MDQNIELHLVIAWNAAVQASKLIRRVVEEGFEVQYKEDESPVTHADKQASRLIESMLKSTNIPVLSEEADTESYEKRKSYEWLWIVDPLDGTREFVRGGYDYTVNIALIHDEKPVLGVIVSPYHEHGWWGVERIGAFKAGAEADILSFASLKEKSISIEPSKDMKPSLRVTGTRSHTNQATFCCYEQIKKIDSQASFMSIGSSLKFCQIAAGEADVYIRASAIYEWDTAAGDAIVRAAGGCVLDLYKHQPLIYNKQSLKQPPFLVVSMPLYEHLQTLWPLLVSCLNK